MYFGNEVAGCRPNKYSDDTFYMKYSLKRRPYLGPTSTDHELAFLMANQGQIRPGDFVYDPFVGTGSIAVALQHFKPFVFGSDLDIRVIKGYGVGRKTKNEIEGLDKYDKFDILTNFKHYGISHPDFFIQDVHAPMLNSKRALFDSIVCDPPYGIRARTQKVGIAETKKAKHEEKKDKIPEINAKNYHEMENFHASMKEQYSQKDIYSDLLENASKMLRSGGRLVFLFHNDDTLSDEENKFP